MSKKSKIIIIVSIAFAFFLLVGLLFFAINQKGEKRAEKKQEEATAQALADFKKMTESEMIALNLPASAQVEVVERDEFNQIRAYRVLGNEVAVPTIEEALKTADSDEDQLLDVREYELGTDPYNIDTDNDLLPDFYEVNIYETDPLSSDSDFDGYTDGDEVGRGYNPKGDGPLQLD